MCEASEKLVELREKLDTIRGEVPILQSGESDVIELDPRNSLHREWYEDR